MMNRGLMKRQMFAMGGPVRMQQGGLAGHFTLFARRK